MIKQTFNLIFFIFLTNTNHLMAHDSFNGGCDHHCKESGNSTKIEKIPSSINVKNKADDDYSCLSKSLCRG